MPSFKPRQVVKILKKLGFAEERQKGSHLSMYNKNLKVHIIVPMHTKDIKKGLIRGIMKDAKSNEKEFLKLR